MIYQDIRRNAVQAYMKYKAYYDKEANASKLKESDYAFVLQLKTDHQWNEIPFTEFRGIGSYIIEKVLPNNNYLLRKIGSDKTHVFYRMQMHHFTSRQPIPNSWITPQEWKPDPEKSLKHDDFYDRAGECEYEEPIFDLENDNVTPPKSTEIVVQSDSATEETWNTPVSTRECCREILPPTEELCDVTDTCTYMELDAETSSEQPNSSPANPSCSKYNLRHNPKPKCNGDYR